MSQKIRKRETGKAKRAETPITTEEQEDVIRELRTKSAKNKKTARTSLDVLVLVAAAMSARAAMRYVESGAPPFLVILTVIQTLLLPLSLSPGWTRIAFIKNVAEQKHMLVTAVQLVIFMAIFVGYRRDTSLPPATIVDFMRWALPELVSGAVEMQRGSEREAESSLGNLEKLKYDVKGA